MRIVLRFWGRALAWAGVLVIALLAITFLSGQGAADLAVSLPSWVGLALALAAFPAGVSIAELAFPAGPPVARLLAQALVAAASLALVLLIAGNSVAPAASRALGGAAGAAARVTEPARMSLGELTSAAREAEMRARGASPDGALAAWREANVLAWHRARRTSGAALPFLFALVGGLAGFWGARIASRPLRLAQYWGVGLLLLVSTYLVGENSYELVVMQAAGPVGFAGEMVLVVPSILLLGLGWPTVVMLWGRSAWNADRPSA